MTNRPGRNDPCPCGSKKKYKQCCWGKELPESDVTKKPFFAKALSSSNNPLSKKKFTAKILGAEKKDEEPPYKDPLESTFSNTLSNLRNSDAPPTPKSDEIPQAEFPEDYEKWEGEEPKK